MILRQISNNIHILQVYASFYVARKQSLKVCKPSDCWCRGMRRHPQAYFSIRCSFISCDKTSTQKLSHSFRRLGISAIDNIFNVLPLKLIKFCFHVTERFLKCPTSKWKVRSKNNQIKMQRGHSYNKSQNLSRKTSAGKHKFLRALKYDRNSCQFVCLHKIRWYLIC